MLILLTLESHMVLSHLLDSANSTYFSARTEVLLVTEISLQIFEFFFKNVLFNLNFQIQNSMTHP